VAYHVIDDQEAASHQVGDNQIVTAHIVTLLGIQKAEGNVLITSQMLSRVSLDEFHEVVYPCLAKGFAGKTDLPIGHLKCGYLASSFTACQRQPERGIPSTRPYLKHPAVRRTCGEQSE
jgi:hypothetical protein